jgi:hypothetical protein
MVSQVPVPRFCELIVAPITLPPAPAPIGADSPSSRQGPSIQPSGTAGQGWSAAASDAPAGLTYSCTLGDESLVTEMLSGAPKGPPIVPEPAGPGADLGIDQVPAGFVVPPPTPWVNAGEANTRRVSEDARSASISFIARV